MPVGLHKIVVGFIQGFQQRLQTRIIFNVGLVLEQVGKGFLDTLIGFKALYLAMTLNLVGINGQGNSLAALGDAKGAVAINNHAALLHTFAQLFIDIGSSARCFSGGCCLPIFLSKALSPIIQHLCLILTFGRIECLARWSEGVALLKAEVHFTSHHFGMLHEIAVVVH